VEVRVVDTYDVFVVLFVVVCRSVDTLVEVTVTGYEVENVDTRVEY
jgi:hypothetical protein